MYSRFVVVLFLFLGLVSSLPSPDTAAATVTVPTALASPTSVTTTNTVQTANGTLIETCVLTFTPVGQQIYETQNCTLSAENASVITMPSMPSTTAPPVAAAFVLPGTTLLVLPVGLFVYGGITGIAFFAVAFVTWERVKYRRMFRQQRMAESGSFAYLGGTAKV